MSCISNAMFAGLLVCFASCAAGSTFLKPAHTQKWLSRDSVQQAFTSVLAMDADLLRKYEDELRPMYDALPKNADGALEQPVVHYALHRYFLSKHGWHMNGLEPTSSTSDSGSPADILKDKVPEFVQGLLQERMRDQGWHLHELAICATALSELIQTEVIDDLYFVYSLAELSPSDYLNEGGVAKVVNLYLAQYLLDETWSDWRFESMFTHLHKTYPGWGDSLHLWLHDVRLTLDFQESRQRNPFRTEEGVSFARVVDIVQEIMHRYTSVQNLECSTLTEELLTMEHKNTGRIPLGDFYSSRLPHPKEYLRHVGALDERDPLRPSVIIPNYIYSKSNCLASSSFFSVCCPNKCDRMLAHLERTLAAPSASPQRIAEIVSALPSDTVDAPRNLSSSLLSRLGEMAEHHGGEVPLHGRLFSQWLHHAYPRECPFPHTERAETMLTPGAWTAKSGARQDLEDLRLFEMNLHRGYGPAPDVQLPWIASEELVGIHSMQRPNFGMGLGLLPKGVPLLVITSLAGLVMRGGYAALSLGASLPSKCEKHLV